MKKPYRYAKPKPYRLYAAIALVSAGLLIIVGWLTVPNVFEPKSQTSVEAAKVSSMFTFTGAKDWRKGPSNATSLALFYEPSDAFLSVEYYPGHVDAAQQVELTKDSLEKDGYNVSSLDTTTAKLSVNSVEKTFTLYRYSVQTANASSELYPFNAIGYLQLHGGYMKIYSHSASALGVNAADAAFDAIRASI